MNTRMTARWLPWMGLASVLALAGCGGSQPQDEAATAAAAADKATRQSVSPQGTSSTSAADAVRLAHQASFGPSEALVAEIQAAGAAPWIEQQMALDVSRYQRGGNDRIHTRASTVPFCDAGAQKDNPNCWRDFYSTEPLVWDFYRNAVGQPDQLRQRVAMALSHFLVVSGHEVSGTYGLRIYQNNLLSLAFDNYRKLLRQVILSPVMGDYLDHVNNDRFAPNENFARELLQLFSLGTCKLEADGTLKGGRCKPVYDNTMVRNYAYALTGWTYPAGGASPWGCWPQGANCVYYGGEMVEAPRLRDRRSRSLLSKVSIAAQTPAPAALELVLDSLMRHPNLAPFVARRLIQHLVSSDPEPAYVGRVAAAFETGRFTYTDGSGEHVFGTSHKGDLSATVAAVLLDPLARNEAPDAPRAGHLRAPALLFTGALRAFNGHTDGEPFNWWWGDTLHQQMFMSPSVFGFYPPDYPVPGTGRVGPEFGIHNTNGALERLNVLTWLFDWGGSAPNPGIPDALGTAVDLSAFTPMAGGAATLVDRISGLLLGRTLAKEPRKKVIDAVSFWTSDVDKDRWRERRVATAAYLLLASPDYQVQR
ncbi:DUF1800 family protein [Ideonella sp. 4Y16]|uniref:DUF1800 family protein n=1 Tax=Ideonella alba TaxID=2824118 RepID=A0A940Y705_9BURK|nr:DUF1800 family protein [Ideonella alba]MBQ0931027.1 DUF1800 family protein [Ideonella alba]MBQ0942309.1 DUF1800 family protein [Ideonella alba]